MKTRTLLSIVSLMIFGAALLLGIAVIAIVMLGSWFDTTPANAVSPVSETYALNTENTASVVYLASDREGTLLRVNNDGTSQTFSLGLSENFLAVGSIAFSSDSRLAAFCPIERVNDEQTTRTLIVRDIEAGTNLLEIPYGSIPACNAEAFSPDNSTIAVSIVFNSAVENYSGSRNDEPDWTLRLLDVNSGAVLREMSADSAFAPNFAAISNAWFDPRLPAMNQVLYYGNEEILFVAYPFYGGDGFLEVPGFRWNFASSTVTEVPGLGRFGADYLPATGELAYPMMDNNLPYAQPMGPAPTANTVQISDSSGTRTIYRNTEWVILQARFINGGRQIAVVLLPAFDPDVENPGAQGNRIEIINRDGTVQTLNDEFIGMQLLYGTGTGFTFQWTDFLNSPPTFYIEVYNGQSLQSIWSYTPDAGNNWLNMVWAAPMPGISGLAPFQAAN